MPNTNEIVTLLTDDNGQFYTPANNGEPATIKDKNGNVVATSLDSVTWTPHGAGDMPEEISVTALDDSNKTVTDAAISKAPDTPEVWPTCWGYNAFGMAGIFFSQNASVYHTYRCAKPDIQDPSGVAHCERPTETDDTPEVESPDTP